MEKAAEVVTRKILERKRIRIIGDYDVDGITSITVLKKFLKERGLDVEYYIPNRLNEGYGLNKQAIEKIKQETRRYAKRQLTWFRKNKQTIWLDALDKKEENIRKILEEIN